MVPVKICLSAQPVALWLKYEASKVYSFNPRLPQISKPHFQELLMDFYVALQKETVQRISRPDFDSVKKQPCLLLPSRSLMTSNWQQRGLFKYQCVKCTENQEQKMFSYSYMFHTSAQTSVKASQLFNTGISPPLPPAIEVTMLDTSFPSVWQRASEAPYWLGQL